MVWVVQFGGELSARYVSLPIHILDVHVTRQTSAAATEQQLTEARAQIAQLQQAAQEAKKEAEVDGWCGCGIIWDVWRVADLALHKDIRQ